MQFLKKPFIALTILIGLITFSNAETSWITKKKDKKDKVEKVEKAEKTSNAWIKKKMLKKIKKNLKKKLKSQSLG